MEENANKLHFKCTDFNFSMHVTVYVECIYVSYRLRFDKVTESLMVGTFLRHSVVRHMIRNKRKTDHGATCMSP